MEVGSWVVSEPVESADCHNDEGNGIENVYDDFSGFFELIVFLIEVKVEGSIDSGVFLNELDFVLGVSDLEERLADSLFLIGVKLD